MNICLKKSKIELKHLAPYLPYRLNTNAGVIKIIDIDSELIEIEYNPDDGSDTVVYFSDIKPILRPLSDITKEIEVNGERFIPVEKIYDGSIYEWKNDKEQHGVFYDYVMDMHTHELAEELQYNVFIMLVEWHFDVFGLIEKGLAINTNELK